MGWAPGVRDQTDVYLLENYINVGLITQNFEHILEFM
jgi:hypothetical protein